MREWLDALLVFGPLVAVASVVLVAMRRDVAKQQKVIDALDRLPHQDLGMVSVRTSTFGSISWRSRRVLLMDGIVLLGASRGPFLAVVSDRDTQVPEGVALKLPLVRAYEEGDEAVLEAQAVAKQTYRLRGLSAGARQQVIGAVTRGDP